MIVSAGRVANARKMETMKRAMKAFNFRLVVRIIIRIMLTITSKETRRAFIIVTGNIPKDSFLRLNILYGRKNFRDDF
jgi:hypothetical protein